MKARRLPVVDEYFEDGEAAVFVGERVILLSPLATRAVDLLGDEWVDVREVAVGLIDTFGPPPGDPTGLGATRAALEALAVQNIVLIDEND